MADFAIRAEEPRDGEAIACLHHAAFGGDLEAQLVDRLRAEEELLVSLVAEAEDMIAGHIAIRAAGIVGASHVKFGWVAPVGVSPERQRHGLGTALVRAALEFAQKSGLGGVIVLGDSAWYGRFGFNAAAAEHLDSRFAGPALQFLPFCRAPVRGQLIEPRAFAVFG